MSNLIPFRLPTAVSTQSVSETPIDDPIKRIKLVEKEVTLYRRDAHDKAVWNYSITLAGVTERKSTKTSDVEKAKKIALDRHQEMLWRVSRKLPIQAVTFKHACDSHIVERKRIAALGGKHSNLRVQTMLLENHICRYFGELEIVDIDQAAIKSYHAEYLRVWQANHDAGSRVRKPSALSMRNHETLIKQVVQHAVDTGMITHHECPVFKRTPGKAQRRGGFEPDELSRLITCLDERAANARNKSDRDSRKMLALYVKVLVACGFRPGVEPTSIRFCDVVKSRDENGEHLVIQVRDGKVGPRKVLAHIDVWDLIEQAKLLHKDPQPTTPVFTQDESHHQNRFVYGFNLVLKELGMTKDATGLSRSLYSLRHTYATQKILRGWNLSFLAKNMGTSVNMLENTYSHIVHLTMTNELHK